MFIIPTSFNNLAEKYLEIIQHGHALHPASGDGSMIYSQDVGHPVTTEE